jgi:hypothetical protein
MGKEMFSLSTYIALQSPIFKRKTRLFTSGAWKSLTVVLLYPIRTANEFK